MAVAGAHSVSVDALCLDATAPPPLNCFVYPEYQWTVPLGKMLNQKRQQNSAQSQGREHSAVEDMVVYCKAIIVAESHDSKRGSYGSLARSQDGANQQYLSFHPCSALKQR